MSNNEKKFSLSIKKTKIYSSIIFGFDAATTLLFRIRDKLKINFSPKLIIKPIITIFEGKLKIILNSKVIVKLTQIIYDGKLQISFTPKEKIKLTLAVILKSPIVFVSNAIQKVIAIIYG